MAPAKKSIVWEYFEKSADNNEMVECRLCNQELKYYSSTGNLRQHLFRKHPFHFNQETEETPKEIIEIIEEEETIITKNEVIDKTREEITDTISENKTSAKKSIVWAFFQKSPDKKFAKCRLCNQKIKFFSSTSNLRQHLLRKHPIQFNQGSPKENVLEITDNENMIIDTNQEEITFQIVEHTDIISNTNSNFPATNLHVNSSSNKLNGIARTYSTPAFTHLSVSVPKEFVYHVQLNRPEKRNSINNDMWGEIKSCFEQLCENEDCRSIVLSGQGSLFCSGMDIPDLTGVLSDFPMDDVARRAKIWHNLRVRLQESVSSLEKCRKPVLAAVHSACVGSGVDLISAADMRYCTKDAWFQVKEVDLGLAADIGTLQRLPKILGSESLVRELCYTARKMTSQEAFDRGLVSRIYETQEEMLTEVIKIAEEIAKKSPVAVQGTKVSLIYARDHSVQEGLNQIALWNQAMLQSEDLVEAIMGQMSKNRNITFSKL